jgi:hypothetical protein
MKITESVSLAAAGSTYSTAHATDGYKRAKVVVQVADLTDAAGTFYVVSKATGDDDWARHPVLQQPKVAGNGLKAVFDWFDLTGGQLAVEWARSAGGAAQTATVYMHLG